MRLFGFYRYICFVSENDMTNLSHKYNFQPALGSFLIKSDACKTNIVHNGKKSFILLMRSPMLENVKKVFTPISAYLMPLGRLSSSVMKTKNLLPSGFILNDQIICTQFTTSIYFKNSTKTFQITTNPSDCLLLTL